MLQQPPTTKSTTEKEITGLSCTAAANLALIGLRHLHDFSKQNFSRKPKTATNQKQTEIWSTQTRIRTNDDDNDDSNNSDENNDDEDNRCGSNSKNNNSR